MRAHHIVQGYEAFRALAFEYDGHRDRLGPILRAQLDAAAGIDADTYDDARRTTRRARRALVDLMADGEVMLTPSAPGAAPAGLGSTGEPTFNRLWTLLGTPCINVPGLSDPDGLPLGVQIVARFARDRFALSAAALLERAIARNECVRPSGNELTRWFVTYYFCIPHGGNSCGNGEYSSPQIILISHQQQYRKVFAPTYQALGCAASRWRGAVATPFAAQ